MPALGSDGKPVHVKKKIVRKPKPKAGPPTPRSSTSRPAPVSQPGPYRATERRKVKKQKAKPSYGHVLQRARTHGPATRRGTSPAGDTKSDADRARAQAYWQGRADRLVGHDTAGDYVPKGEPRKGERKILEHMGLTRRTGLLINRSDEEGKRYPGGKTFKVRRQKLAADVMSRSGNVSAGGLKALEQTTRPLHASAGAVDALVRGKSVKQAVKEGAKGFTSNEGKTYSNVLKSAGVKNKTVRAVGGLVLDFVADPSAGAKVSKLAPKTVVERQVAELEARAAKAERSTKVKVSRPKKAQKLRTKAAKKRRKADTLSDGAGIQVGYSAKVPFGPRIQATTRGRATSRAGKKLTGAADRARSSKVAQAAQGAFSPTARKTGETAAEHRKFVYASRKRRANLAEAERQGQRRGTAHARATRRVDTKAMVDAIEGAAKKPLTATKRVQRRAPEHRTVTIAQRSLKTAKSKLRKEQGRAEVLREQARSHGIVFRAPGRLVKAQQAVKAAETTLENAIKAAQGVPKNARFRVDAATGQRYTDFKATAPVHAIGDLPPKAQKVARATRAELDALETEQRGAGVLEGKRTPYYPHRLIKVKKATGSGGRKGRPAKTPYAKRRTDERPIAEIHAERAARGKDPLFSTDHGTVIADYTRKAKSAVADSKYLKDVKAAGKPLTASTWAKRRDTDGLYRITDTGIQAVKHPSGRELGQEEVQQLIAKGEDVTILPRARGDAELQSRAPGKNEGTRAALRVVQRPMQAFKTMATVMNVPYYQERNFIDDSFHAWQADTPLSAGFKAVKLVKDRALWERAQKKKLNPKPIDGTISVAGVEMPRAQFLDEAVEDGAMRTGFFAGDDLLEGSMKPITGIRRIRPVQKVREWSQNPEDVPRLSTYFAARDRGLTRSEAAAHMRLYHFDYDELTDIEKMIRATLIPFYTYAKKNTLLQARMFVSRPGKVSAIQKLREEADKYGAGSDEYRAMVKKLGPLLKQAQKAGVLDGTEVGALKKGQFEGLLTETDQRAFPTLGPGGNLIYMPLGITDANRIPFATSWDMLKALPKQQFDLAMQMVGPQKLPLEMSQNYSFFFRDSIYRTAQDPEAQRWVTAPGWAKKAGIPTVVREVDGKNVESWPAWLDYTVRSLGPQAGVLATLGNPVKSSRGQGVKDLAFKQATGLRKASIDDRIIVGLMEKTSKELGRVRVKIADSGEVPKYRGRTDDQFFFSTSYQKLLDEQKTLQGLMDALKTARSGVKPVKPIRLSRRPLPYDQQLQQRLDDRMEKYGDYGGYLEKKYKREAAKQKIMSGGGG